MEIVHIYSKQVRDFCKPIDLKVSDVEVLVDQYPNAEQEQKYMPKYFIEMDSSCEREYSEHNVCHVINFFVFHLLNPNFVDKYNLSGF